MKNNIEIRNFNFDVRAEQNEQHGHFISGRAIVYGQPSDMGWYREFIDDGALDSTDLKDVRLLVNHDTSMIPLARSRNNNANSTMQLSVVPNGGMDIRADLDTEHNGEASSLYSAVERGDISGMSFMFTVDGDRWEGVDTDYPTRHITSISRVLEVSAVTFPAYEQTSLEARGMSEALDSARASLDSAKAAIEARRKQKQKIRIMTEVFKNGL